MLHPDLPLLLLGIERTEGTVVATRLLGGRWLLQGMLGVIAARRGYAARIRAGRCDAAVETAHAASMLALVVLAPRSARAAAISAAVACAFAAADALATARLQEAAAL